ncbi:MAG: PEP-CTERM sorting domain-containing protein [Akkermansia sp.]
MKSTYFSSIFLLSLFASGVQAATIQLLPSITGVTAAGYNSGGQLPGDGILGSDVKGWLSSRSDGWYTTTGNHDMNWGSVTANIENQTLNLPNMKGTNGVCAGMKLTFNNLNSYSDMTFSFNLTPATTGPAACNWSLWYETKTGDVLQLGKDHMNASSDPWNVSYTVNSEQYKDVVNDGNGKIYVVIGSTGGDNGQNATIKDISLTGTVAAVPEPTTATMALFALASLLLRRKRS